MEEFRLVYNESGGHDLTPCRRGISHNEKEEIELDRTVPAVNVLLDAVLARAMRDEMTLLLIAQRFGHGATMMAVRV